MFRKYIQYHTGTGVIEATIVDDDMPARANQMVVDLDVITANKMIDLATMTLIDAPPDPPYEDDGL